ncbi:hypothetical protein BU14_1538s0001 [Porphyra umbilicalis]|uniref:Uncharacterized protein n=1 Tax=Porphyra umbilicalis TaxID=2786 RepID=A0A1X6NLD3_PORUM|nr:hypothetical protein BU14_1538s0001 [Porphyra umbilicalis]|eukprot:OSX69415.1 hypothetical protein BU14_1538s0001 [Porphyra umbilicalis]
MGGRLGRFGLDGAWLQPLVCGACRWTEGRVRLVCCFLLLWRGCLRYAVAAAVGGAPWRPVLPRPVVLSSLFGFCFSLFHQPILWSVAS